MCQMIQPLLSDATAPSIGPELSFNQNERIDVRMVASAAGDVSAILNLEGSFDGNDWFSYAVIDIAGKTSVTDGSEFETYPHFRANLAAITGIDAKATVFLLPGP